MTRSAAPALPRTAVIGAGLAGLACAESLCTAGVAVSVFDKGRGPGGRLSTRRVEGMQFDHGAQYLTARDPDFRDRMARWLDQGVAAAWTGRMVRLTADAVVEESAGERFVGVPGMNALVKAMADGVTAAGGRVAFGTRVTALHRSGTGWALTGEDGGDLGRFDRVVVAVPAPQAADLLRPVLPDLAARVATARLAPCWTVMAAFDRPLDVAWEAAFVSGPGGDGGGSEERPLAWVARNGAKPGRDGTESWVMHAGPDWSARHLEDMADSVKARLLLAFTELVGPTPALLYAAAHRWRYAMPVEPLAVPALWEPAAGIALCGDWCLGARGEAAWLSGRAAARHLLGDPDPAGPGPVPATQTP